jgi:hypothetical protein
MLTPLTLMISLQQNKKRTKGESQGKNVTLEL